MNLIGVAEVAKMLGVRPSSVYEWVRMDYIPHVRLGVGKIHPCVRFDETEVIAWVNKKKQKGRSTRLPNDGS